MARIQAVLLFVLVPQLAGLSIDKMQLGASQARDPFIFVVRRALIIHQQMLDGATGPGPFVMNAQAGYPAPRPGRLGATDVAELCRLRATVAPG